MPSRAILMLVALVLALPAWGGTLDRKEATADGTIWWGSFENAPFPYKGSPYKDDTIAIFVPKHFCAVQLRAKVTVKDAKGKKSTRNRTVCYSESLEKKYKKEKVSYRVVRSNIDYVVHFHGHSNTAAKAMRNHRLPEQFRLSLQNAILVVPQGPVNAVDSADGKLGRSGGFRKMMLEVHAFLQDRGVIRNRQQIGNIIVSSHSGGYVAATHALSIGGIEVRELFLFDSLYSNVEEVFEWLRKDRSRKLINLYFRDKPRARSRELMARLRGAGIAYKDLTHADLKTGKFGRKDLYRKRVIFIETELGHSGCTNKFFNFRDYLYASCLHRYHSSDWFEKKGLERFD